MTLTVAIHQLAGFTNAVQANLHQLRDSAAEAAEAGADLLILPELWLTGYNIGERVHDLAETPDGPGREEVARIARKEGVAVLYGYPEREGDAVYNAAQLIDAEGQSLANFRKAHLFGDQEKRLFYPGDTPLSVVEMKGVKLGILICYDVEFPEAVRSLCLQGADLIVSPTALMAPYTIVSTHVVPTRAYENQCFVAYANRCGEEADLAYVGLSCICGPDGGDIVRAGDSEEMVVATIDPADRYGEDDEYDFFEDRRQAIYTTDI